LYDVCLCKESREDSEVDSTSKAAGDVHIVDVTGEFVGCQDIIDSSSHDGSSDADACARSASVPSAAHTEQADAEPEGLSEAVASIRVEDDFAASSASDVEVAIVIGGMDTGGEIFDDCLVFRLMA